MSSPAKDMAYRLDPALLMEAAGMQPDPWQVRLLRGDWRRGLLLCSRQAGKSTAAAALALHAAAFTPNALVLLLSPSQRQSAELFEKVIGLRGGASEPGTAVTKQSALRLRMANGSRIVSLPGSEKTVRGYSGADLLVVDEAARVEGALYRSVRPMLATSGGRLLAATTPHGKRGWFYRAWMEGSGWFKERITAEECPRISSGFLEEERRALGRRYFAQEYLCRFVEREDSLFSEADITGAFDPAVTPLFETANRQATPSASTIQPLDL